MPKSIRIVGYLTDLDRKWKVEARIIPFSDEQTVTTCQDFVRVANEGVLRSLALEFSTEENVLIEGYDMAFEHLGGIVLPAFRVSERPIYFDETGQMML